MTDILVSVVCTAYNHERYIKSALDGFIMQKTKFKFEVIVHDDASTDTTAAIIREYEKRYPDIIKPIYQTENQYSKGVRIFEKFILPQVKGKYIASCEGDDYWIDAHKLQKQFDIMEIHPEIDICAHGAIVCKNDSESAYICPANEITILTVEQVIAGWGNYVATATLFSRKELYDRAKPKFLEMMAFDYTRQIYGSLRGGMLFLPDKMAVYNYGTAGSWTERVAKHPIKYLAFCKRLKDCMLQLNIDTGYKYKKQVDAQVISTEFSIDLCKGNFRKLISEYYRDELKKRSAKRQIYVFAMALFFGNRHRYEDKE